VTDWEFEFVTWALLSIGLVSTHSLFLVSQFLTKSQGYMWRATRKIWTFLSLLFIVELIIAAVFFHLMGMVVSYSTFPRYLLALVVGLLAASTPTALERIALPKKGTTVAMLKKPLARILLKYNLALRYQFAWAIESCRQQDLYDCQQPDGWRLGLSPTEISRRIRVFYEIAKDDIAKGRNDPSLLKYDVNRNSWEKFYLLVRHVGRKKLRHYISLPPQPPCPGWNGSERRRHDGTANDRKDTLEPEGSTHRSYDNLTPSKLKKKGTTR
jgi:hypothetical protein